MTIGEPAREESLAEGRLHLRIAPITWLTIHRPEHLNVLDRKLLATLAELIAELEHLPDVRLLVITGAGTRAFAAGADLREISAITDRTAAETLSRQGQAALARLTTSPLPTIAAINGVALGGGCELALSCDMRIATRGASFGMPEVSLGLIPGFGGTQRLPSLIGLGGALRLIFSGETIAAEEALRYGLVEQVVDDEHLHDAVYQLAKRIIQHPANAIAAAKSAVYKSTNLPLAQGLIAEAERFGEQVVSQEARKAVAAFFASRCSKT